MYRSLSLSVSLYLCTYVYMYKYTQITSLHACLQISVCDHVTERSHGLLYAYVSVKIYK